MQDPSLYLCSASVSVFVYPMLTQDRKTEMPQKFRPMSQISLTPVLVIPSLHWASQLMTVERYY